MFLAAERSRHNQRANTALQHDAPTRADFGSCATTALVSVYQSCPPARRLKAGRSAAHANVKRHMRSEAVHLWKPGIGMAYINLLAGVCGAAAGMLGLVGLMWSHLRRHRRARLARSEMTWRVSLSMTALASAGVSFLHYYQAENKMLEFGFIGIALICSIITIIVIIRLKMYVD